MRQTVDTDRGLLIVEYDGALVDAVATALGDLKRSEEHTSELQSPS